MAKIGIIVDGKKVLVDEGFKNLPKEKQDATVEEIKSKMAGPAEDAEPETGRLAAFGRGAADTVAFGFDDEIAGAIHAALTDSTRDESIASFRQGKEQAQADRPGWYLGGQVGGGAASMLIPGANIARSATMLPAMAKGGAVGLAQGALYGMGDAEGTIGERASQSLDDAAAGGIAGAVAPPLLRGAGAALRAGGRGARAVGHAVAPGVVRSNADEMAHKYVAEALTEGGGTVDEAIREAQRLNVPVGAANAGTRMRTGSEIQNARGKTRQAVDNYLDDLLAEKKGDIATAMRQGTGGPNSNPYVWKENFIKSVGQQGDAEYNKIWAKGQAAGPNSSSVASTLLKDKQLSKMVKSALPPGTKFDPAAPTLEQAEIARRALKELGGGSDSKAAYYRNQEKVLRGALDREHKDLAGVRNIWADKYAMDEAFDAGSKGFKRNSLEAEQEFMNLPDVGKPLWRKGMYAKTLADLIDADADSVATTKRMAHTQGGRRLLDLASQGNGDAVVKVVDEFDAVADLNRWARLGSKTAQMDNLKKGSPLRSGMFAAWAMGNLFGGNTLSAVQHGAAAAAFLPSTLKTMNPQTQKKVLKLMLSRDYSAVSQAMDAYMNGSEGARKIAKQRIENLANATIRSLSVVADTDTE